MIKSKKVIYCLFLTIIVFSLTILKSSAQTPIIDIVEEQDTFTPSSMPDDWDYYIVNPGSSFPDITYQGSSSTTMYYSSESSSAFTTLNTNRNPGQLLSNAVKSSDSRGSSHPFYDGEELPRAVRTATDDEASYSTKQLMPISLHMNYAFTFLALDSLEYHVMINSSDPFYLDVDLKDDSAEATLVFETSIFPYSGVPLTNVWKETIPIFPMDEMTLSFTFEVNSNTIVSLTPHKMGSRSSITVPVNNTFGAEIVQDIPSPLPTDQERTAEDINKKIGFSLRQFSLPLVEGEYYRIYLFMNDLDPSTNHTVPFLLGENFQVIGGALNEDGYLVRATADTKLTLVLYSKGYTNQEYTIYFRNVVATAGTADLELNINTTLESGIRYLFTLNKPSMMAINYTGSAPTFSLYKESGIPENPWVYVTNQNSFYRESGELYDSGLDYVNWIYVPAGNYALDPGTLSDVIMFHVVEVQTLTLSLPLTVNQNSVFAFEIPESSIRFNQINRINMSTTDHKNESITYQYSIEAKYNEFFTEINSKPSISLGNQETSPGSWIAYNQNNTKIIDFIPSRPKEIPIIVIRPSNAWNNTPAQISTFTQNLVIKLDQFIDYYPLDTAITTRSFFGTGTIILTSSVVSGNKQFIINDDMTTDNDQVLGIPISMNPNQLYNITLYLKGNYTSAGNLNATFQGININSGNIGNIQVFSSQTSGTTLTYRWINLLVLTVSPISYLYADIQRTSPGGGVYRNCTLEVDVKLVSVSPLTFNLTDVQNWNPSRLNGERKDSDYLFEEIIPSEFSAAGLDLSFLLLVGVVVVVAAGAGGAFYYFRTRRGI